MMMPSAAAIEAEAKVKAEVKAKARTKAKGRDRTENRKRGADERCMTLLLVAPFCRLGNWFGDVAA
jgi:hypothetical protein